jgi:hypothetical protein
VLGLKVLQCLPMFAAFPYLLEEEEAYEPPRDTSPGKRRSFRFQTVTHGVSAKTIMEIDDEALNNMPRAQAIEYVCLSYC